MSQILIIEDEVAIADLEKDYLELSDFQVEIRNSGDTGLRAALESDFDLIILDLMLPGMDGLSAIQYLRKQKEYQDLPMIMLTAKDGVADKVKGLKLGADDYMTKPFYRDELIARVNALLRRYNNSFDGFQIAFKDLKFDIAQKKVTIKDEALDLTGKSYDILEYLVRNKDIIITKEQLFNRIWGFESETIWSVVEVYVSNIRKMLKKYDYHIYLKTLRNVGYMWSEKE